MQRACDACGTVYEAKRATSKFCGSTCRMRASRRGGVARPAPVAAAGVCGDLESAVLTELSAQSVERTAAGQSALALARRVDAGAEQAAPLVKQMLDAMDRVLTKSAGRSRLDQLRERRSA